MIVLGPIERVRPVALFFEALRKALLGLTLPSNLPLFSLQNPADLKNEMEEAGFRDVETETRDHLEVLTEDQLWTTMRSAAPPVAGHLQQLSQEQLAAVEAALHESLRVPAQLPIASHVGIGVK